MLAAIAGQAHARDRIAMPFSCSVDGGRLRVEPAHEQSYAIVGGHDQQPFTYCPVGEYGRCHTWMVHRFVVQCTGGRAPWPEVVAAAAGRIHPRASIEGGQLMLRLGPRRIAGADRWCDDGGRMPGRAMAGPVRCELAGMPPPRNAMRTHLLALPRGFAPLGLVGARMLIDADPAPRPPVLARAPAPEMQPPAPPPASPQTAQPTPKPVATVAPKPVEPVVKIEPLEPIPVAPIEIVAPAMPIPAPIPIEIAPVIEATSPPTPPPLVPTPMPAVVSSAAAWKPWIEITPANAAREEPSPAAKVAEGNLRFIALLLLATVSLIATGALFRRRGVPASPRAEPSFTNGPGDGERAIALRTKAEGQVALINRALAQLTTVAPLRNALARDLQASERRLAAVVAGSASTASADGMGRARRRLERIAQDLDRLQQIADSAISSMSGMRAGVELPRNKHEAYATLGVTPGVSDAILKKLVEALRISWHPDLGSTEEERAARNIRITEINVAWDLITGKRQSE